MLTTTVAATTIEKPSHVCVLVLSREQQQQQLLLPACLPADVPPARCLLCFYLFIWLFVCLCLPLSLSACLTVCVCVWANNNNNKDNNGKQQQQQQQEWLYLDRLPSSCLNSTLFRNSRNVKIYANYYGCSHIRTCEYPQPIWGHPLWKRMCTINLCQHYKLFIAIILWSFYDGSNIIITMKLREICEE